MDEHLVFYDSACPFCDRSVRHLLQIDKKKHLLFAPLQGKTAQDVLCGPQKKLLKIDSLILVENYQSTEREFRRESSAILRIYWILGGAWKILGVFSFFPSFIGDFFYRKFAAHRHKFKLEMCQEGLPLDRFLP